MRNRCADISGGTVVVGGAGRAGRCPPGASAGVPVLLFTVYCFVEFL